MHPPPMHRDDWEDWTDEETVTVTPKKDHFPLVHLGTASPSDSPISSAPTTFASSARRSKPRLSAPKIQRLKSRKRQKQQNEKAGIRLVTDMTRFRKGPHHVAQLVKPDLASVPSVEALKFVDASALRALEGSPNSASMGNWAWLQNTSQSPASSPTPDRLHPSPEGNKIVIGIAMPEEDAAARAISPQTATVATPKNRLPAQTPIQHHQASAWSPDTEDGMSPARFLQSHQPGIYAQSLGHPTAGVPPVPAVPSIHKNPAQTRRDREIDDDDDFTPVTLFEEDGRKSPTSALSKISPETTRSRSGWWDHVKTPFKERFSPSSRFGKEATSPDEWWKSTDEKKDRAMPQQYAASEASSSTLRPIVPIIRQPSPTVASSSRSVSSAHEHKQEDPRSEKAQVAMDEHADEQAPPPYERTPSSKHADAEAVRYRAVFPAGHHLASQFPPTPQPGRGISSNEKTGVILTTKHIMMTDVPLTPAPTGAASEKEQIRDREDEEAARDLPVAVPLPDRVAGTYAGDQFADVRGDDNSPAARVEKTRRRHEKEDVLARRAGGFWKGRGCIPEDGCYGRSGREGRQRRRVWLFICLAFWLLTVIGVVLGVVLSRRLGHTSSGGTAGGSSTTASGSSSATPTSSGASSSDTPDQASSVWLNLTDFPAIPTGLATIVGPDNSEAISGCVAPATLWSCSLPPEQQAANEPSAADQPTFIFQIQYDNNTRRLWDIPNGDAPTPATTSSAKTTATATSTGSSSAASATATDVSRLTRRDGTTLYDTGIAPNPEPPSYDDMWFLGNWTDGIVSSNKSGEPTPFYISFFTTLSGSAGPNMLTDDTSTSKNKRSSVSDLLPDPPLAADGTGAAAQLRPFPTQQPLRLYDRGLATEHYGFYSYFNKTIYVSSVNTSESADAEGGVLRSSAAWYATWAQTRFVVKIWTRKTTTGGARLIGSGGASDSNTTSPGTFPYPMTVGEDTHGGDLQLKQAFAYGVEADGRVNLTEWSIIDNNISYGSPVVNAAEPDGDLSWGGTDGGTGGCRCEWVNWVNEDGDVDTTFG